MRKIVEFRPRKKEKPSGTEFVFKENPAKFLFSFPKDKKPDYDFRRGWELFKDDWRFVENSLINYTTLAMGVSVAIDVAKDFEAATELQAIMQELFDKKVYATHGKFIPKHLLGFMFYFGDRDNSQGIPEVDKVFSGVTYSSSPALKFSIAWSSDKRHIINNLSPRPHYYQIPFVKK